MNVAVFTKNRVNPAYAAARLGAERAAARWGAQVTHYVPDEPDDADQQYALLERALAARHDAIALSPVHPTKLLAVIGKINAAGIPLVGFISRPNAGRWDAFVGSDDYRLASEVASYLFRALPGRADVVIIEGLADSSTSIDRVRGFHAAATAQPGIRIVGACRGRYQFEPARREFAKLLAQADRVDGVLAANDVMALGAISALRAAGRDALVVGVNAIPEAIAAIKQGSMLATADFSAMNLGAVAVECAIRRARGEAVPGEILLPVQIVDRGNVSAWDRPYEERACLEWAEALKHGGIAVDAYR